MSGSINFCVIFTAAVIIQSLHMVEHIAQIIQKFWLKLSEAHGILGMFDFEWVYFAYNGVLILTLYILISGCVRLLQTRSSAIFSIFVAGVIVQSYHMVEHIVKIVQHIQAGLHGTPGILGNFINPIWFHFSINLVVLILIVIPFFSAEGKSSMFVMNSMNHQHDNKHTCPHCPPANSQPLLSKSAKQALIAWA